MMGLRTEEEHYSSVGTCGFVPQAVDTKDLATYEDFYHALRLDYANSPFRPEAGSCYVLRFIPGGEKAKLDIPRTPEYNLPYPFTGTRFTAGNHGRIGVPEFVIKTGSEVALTPGQAEIWEVCRDGTERLHAVFGEDGWSEVKL